jgi:hypothetical protein
MASHSKLAPCAALALLACRLHALGDKLHITSIPPGAAVELDGVSAGGYFHKTKTSMGARAPNPIESVDSLTTTNAALPTAPEAFGAVSISSDPDGAEIFVDDKFHGNTPATLRLSASSHAVLLKLPGHADWRRTLEILKSSKTSLKAALDPSSRAFTISLGTTAAMEKKWQGAGVGRPARSASLSFDYSGCLGLCGF